ncbi:inner membrane protein YiaA [Veronia pacifica]|uniref:YiaAB two helix domain-containing protein n=1 Tax=Veronia pacifica TaxID=1080227 RepID=A0A1C3ECK6_9GAMM|nr:inner membrane protein YiaA [Veronia pacifica]ODA30940.1 hypothetical protein A8L45_18565 [Veronia pacifica]
MQQPKNHPTQAFIIASWASFALGVTAYCLGLWNSDMMLNEKGYYLVSLLFGLFSAVSLQKTVRDQQEGIDVTRLYALFCVVSVFSALAFVSIGLWNASLTLSEKGFYGIAYVLSLYAVIAVQKNVRDIKSVHQEKNSGRGFNAEPAADEVFNLHSSIDSDHSDSHSAESSATDVKI